MRNIFGLILGFSLATLAASEPAANSPRGVVTVDTPTSPTPLVFALTPKLTLLHIIVKHVLNVSFSDIRKVRLVRGKQVTVYDTRALRTHGEKDVILEPGDIIEVPRSYF